ncbi:MAG: ribonuclease T [Pseudomonadota bacterium]
MTVRSGTLAVLLLAAACKPASGDVHIEAADAGCDVPDDLASAAVATPPDDRPDAPVTGYLLALSWSPEYCRFRADDPASRGQCVDNRFGLIVHGLWPQAAARPHPRSCTRAEPVPAALMQENFCMMPSASLMQHQWRAHGTCAWDEPRAYFADTAALWAAVAPPDLFALSRQDGLSAAGVRAAFVATNPGWTGDMIGIDLNRRGWLEEIRLCLDLDRKPRRCSVAERGASDTAPVSIWRGGRA